MQKVVLPLFIISCFFCQVFAQQKLPTKGDTLLKEFAAMKTDTSRIKLLKHIVIYYRDNDPDKSIVFCNQALILAAKLHDDLDLCYFYGVLGEAYGNKGDWPNCTKEFTRLYDFAVEKKISSEIARASSDLAAVYENNSDYVKAQEYNFKCLSISETVHNYFLMAVSTSNIGLIYSDQENYDKAIQYQLKALDILTKYKLQKPPLRAYALSIISNSYAKKHEYVKARSYGEMALKISSSLQDTSAMITRYDDLAATYPKDYQRQLLYAKAARHLAEKMNITSFYYITTLGRLGKAYANLVQFNAWNKGDDSVPLVSRKAVYLKNATAYLEQAIALAVQNKEKNLIMNFSQELSEVYKLSGQYKKALDRIDTYNSLYDSIYSQGNKNKIAALEGKHEIELRDKQLVINNLVIADQKKQKWILLTGLGTICLIAGLIFYQSRQRRKANLELVKLNDQLDEADKIKMKFFGILNHDLRSPVASFVNLLHLQKDAPDLLDDESRERMSASASVAAENLLSTMDDLLLWTKGQMENFRPHLKDVQVSTLFQYLQGLSVNYNVKFSFSQSGDIKLHTDENYIRTIIHNLSINSVKALKNSEQGIVEWTAWEKDSLTYLSIKDNGPGATEEQLKPLYDDSAPIGIQNGLGLHIVRDIAKAIGCKIVVKQVNPGVEIRLEFPQN